MFTLETQHSFFQVDKAFAFIQDAEQRERLGFAEVAENGVDPFAFFQQLAGGVDGVLRGDDVEIGFGHFHAEVLGDPVFLASGQDDAILGLDGIEICHPEVEQTVGHFNFVVVFRLLCGTAGLQAGVAGFQVDAFGAWLVGAVFPFIGGLQLRQHAQERGGLVFAFDRLLQLLHFQVEVVFQGVGNARRQVVDAGQVGAAFVDLVKMFQRFFPALLLIIVGRLASGYKHKTQCRRGYSQNSCHNSSPMLPKRFNHQMKLPIEEK